MITETVMALGSASAAARAAIKGDRYATVAAIQRSFPCAARRRVRKNPPAVSGVGVDVP